MDDSGKNVSIALEGPSDVIATSKKTRTEEPGTKEFYTERMGVERLRNPEVMGFFTKYLSSRCF